MFDTKYSGLTTFPINFDWNQSNNLDVPYNLKQSRKFNITVMLTIPWFTFHFFFRYGILLMTFGLFCFFMYFYLFWFTCVCYLMFIFIFLTICFLLECAHHISIITFMKWCRKEWEMFEIYQHFNIVVNNYLIRKRVKIKKESRIRSAEKWLIKYEVFNLLQMSLKNLNTYYVL